MSSTTPDDLHPLDLTELRAALSDAGQPWEMGYTSITALDEAERALRLGVPARPELEDTQEADKAAARAASAEAVGAPAAFDVRNVSGISYDTSVKDQGGCGSCVAFGSAAAMEVVFRFSRRTLTPMDLSEAHLFYCHGRAEGRNCGNGWWPDRALLAARDKGVTFEDYYPYTAGDQNCTGLNADWPNRLAKVTAFEDISTGTPLKMKEAISTYGAVTACFNVYQDFYSYRSGVYRHVTGSLRRRALRRADRLRRCPGGCWIARNSWGVGWGDSGILPHRLRRVRYRVLPDASP